MVATVTILVCSMTPVLEVSAMQSFSWAQRAEEWGECSFQAENRRTIAQVKLQENMLEKAKSLDKADFYSTQADRVARFAGTNPDLEEWAAWKGNHEAACFYQKQASIFQKQVYKAREEWEAANKAAREYASLQANAAHQAALDNQANPADQAATCVEHKPQFVFSALWPAS